jgi:hypothetical protein
MKSLKKVLIPQRLRQVPEQFSWVDQSLVQRHFIDRCDARAAALYLFLITVADVQGLSYYGDATLTQRLHMRAEELGAARAQLIALELIAYQAPLYQVLALPGTKAARAVPMVPAPPAEPPRSHSSTGPVCLAQLLKQLERRRAGL